MIQTATLAHRARQHGARHAWKIIMEARRARISVHDAFALVEQESNFRNVFGHDAGAPFAGERVTNSRVRALLEHTARGGVSNGVGLTQLTWPPFIRRAASLRGGAASPWNQCGVGFTILKSLQLQHGREGGFAAYNGDGPAADAYGRQVIARADKWEKILWPK